MNHHRQISPALLGRWEWIQLPGTSTATHKARIDTGARRSSLHATDITPSVTPGITPGQPLGAGPATDPARDGDAPQTVTFTLPCGTRTTRPLVGMLDVRSSNGTTETRPVITLPTTIAGITITTLYTLTDRSAMRYPALIGRDLLAGRFLVDPSRGRQHPRPASAAARQEIRR
jgi:ribosomal protein S6--L-glutamate ligase